MKHIFTIALIMSSLTAAVGQYDSQWRGSGRNGTYNETDLLKSWPEEGPELIWHAEGIGTGNSSASVTGNKVFITGRKDTLEYLSAFSMKGELIWSNPFGRAWPGSFPDTRTTASVIDGKIYVISGSGEVVCLDEKSGNILWTVDAYNKFEGYWTLWGISESPLVFDDKVIFTPGGMKTTMVALDRENGETIWTSDCLKDSIAYVSPTLIEYGGKKIIASISATYFFGINAENGKLLWKFNYSELCHFDHPYAPVINAITPLYHDGEIYITKGYDHEGAKFRLSEDAENIDLIWTDTIMDTHLGGVVLVDGYLYGSNWLHNRDGNWCCIDWNSGETKYETHWNCKGSIIAADGMLYCFEEKQGNVALVEPTPEEFRIISSFTAPFGRGPAWAHPTISDGNLYIRRGDALMVYKVRQ